MKLEELKQGDTFYKVTAESITRYEWLMLYPFHNPVNVRVEGYHIILNKNLDEPLRIYYRQLRDILAQEVYTYEQAKMKQLEMAREKVEFLEKEL